MTGFKEEEEGRLEPPKGGRGSSLPRKGVPPWDSLPLSLQPDATPARRSPRLGESTWGQGSQEASTTKGSGAVWGQGSPKASTQKAHWTENIHANAPPPAPLLSDEVDNPGHFIRPRTFSSSARKHH